MSTTTVSHFLCFPFRDLDIRVRSYTLAFPHSDSVCAFVSGTSNQDQEETERKDEQGGSGDHVPSPPRPAVATAQSKAAEGHPNSLRATSGQEDSACQERRNFPRAGSGQDSQGLSFDGLTLEHFELPLEARDAFTTAAAQLQSNSPEHLIAHLEDAAWKVSANCVRDLAASSFGPATIYVFTFVLLTATPPCQSAAALSSSGPRSSEGRGALGNGGALSCQRGGRVEGLRVGGKAEARGGL
jgi:hypothetical protein